MWNISFYNNNVTCLLLLSMYCPHPCHDLPVRRLGRFLSNPWMEYILTLFMVYSPPVRMTVFSSSIAQAYLHFQQNVNQWTINNAILRSLVFHLKQDTWPLFSDQFSCISTLRIMASHQDQPGWGHPWWMFDSWLWQISGYLPDSSRGEAQTGVRVKLTAANF